MFQQVLTISRNTFVESIRQPIFVVLILAATIGVVICASSAANTLDDDNKMLYDTGMSTLLLAGLALGAFTAARVISIEVEKKTVLTVVSKPVARPLFVLGKYLGVAAALSVAFWVLALVFLLAVRHQVLQTARDELDGPVLTFGLLALFIAVVGAAAGNYLYRWVFTSSFIYSLTLLMSLAWLLVLMINKSWHFQSISTEFVKDDGTLGQLIMGLVLVYEAILLLAAVAVAASTRLGQVMTLVICAGAFLMSLMSSSLFGKWVHDVHWADVEGFWSALGWLGANLVYKLTPNLQFLWLADDLTQGNTITGGYVLWVSAYTLVFIAAILSLAVALFQTREVG